MECLWWRGGELPDLIGTFIKALHGGGWVCERKGGGGGGGGTFMQLSNKQRRLKAKSAYASRV